MVPSPSAVKEKKKKVKEKEKKNEEEPSYEGLGGKQEGVGPSSRPIRVETPLIGTWLSVASEWGNFLSSQPSFAVQNPFWSGRESHFRRTYERDSGREGEGKTGAFCTLRYTYW